MNIENIAALAAQLHSLGFENLSSSILKRISFRPVNFLLFQRMKKGNDQLSFHLYFEKDNKENAYSLQYYDATLQNAAVLVDTTVNGVNIPELEKKMAEIDWKTSFELDNKKQWSVTDKASWEKELKVESAVEELEKLESSDDGKVVAASIKIKYWAGMPYQELVGNISPLKSKSEVSQRFYVSDGQPGISVDEAYRFLQNRWWEKQMQAKKKQAEISQTGENENDSQSSSGSGLLKKKRFGSGKGAKKNKTVQQ